MWNNCRKASERDQVSPGEFDCNPVTVFEARGASRAAVVFIEIKSNKHRVTLESYDVEGQFYATFLTMTLKIICKSHISLFVICSFSHIVSTLPSQC